MKKFQCVTDIAIGSNCLGVIIRGEYSSPKGELSKGIVRGQFPQVGIAQGRQLPLVAIARGGIVLEPQTEIFWIFLKHVSDH